jgi:RNA 2',3'-cyclic 3'-phosphodiesterase
MSAARRFVALPVPAEVREQVRAALPRRDGHGVEGLRWSRPEGWHLTLAFLGQVTDDRVPAITEAITGAVDAAAQVPEGLRIDGIGRFGRKVLWIGVEDRPPGSLTPLVDAVRAAVGSLGFEVEGDRFHAHVTLARAGRRQVSTAVVEACAVPEGLAWSPSGVELWRSELGQGPARYETEAVVPFGDDGADGP